MTHHPQTTDRPFADEPTDVLRAALGLATRHAEQAARFRPAQPDDALPAVVGLLRAELQHREGTLLPPPEGPEYTPCSSCTHIEPEHQPDAGPCLVCDCRAYEPAAVSAAVAPPTNRAPYGSPDCTCVPFTRKDGTPRACGPHDTVDDISGWETSRDCPDHAPAAAPPTRAALRDRIAEAMRTAPSDDVRPDWTAPGGPLKITARINDLADAVLAVLPEPTDRAAVLREAADARRLRTENERLRHELEVMYGGAFDNLPPGEASGSPAPLTDQGGPARTDAPEE